MKLKNKRKKHTNQTGKPNDKARELNNMERKKRNKTKIVTNRKRRTKSLVVVILSISAIENAEEMPRCIETLLKDN